MADTKELDQAMKAFGKLVDDWGKTLGDLAKDMKKLADEAEKAGKGDKDGGDDKASKDAEKKKQDLQQAAEAANKELAKKIMAVKLPTQADPKQAIKLPDLITKYITTNGVKIGDYGSIKPDIDFDPKKMQIKKAVLVWTWDW